MPNHLRADGRDRGLTTGSFALAYSIPDAAARIGISRSTLYALISAGQIPVAKIGSRSLVLDQDLQDFLLRCRTEILPALETAV